MDWASRYVLSWRMYGYPFLRGGTGRSPGAIWNAGNEQDSQFTSKPWVGRLLAKGIKISMDGKGRYLDNIFDERLWRTVKYEDLCLKRYESVRELKAGLHAYFRYYNESCLHQGLNYQTPQEVYFNGIEKPFKSLTTLEPLSNTQNDDDYLILDPSVA